MKQGCTLAPYLFLFFAKAMAHFLRAHTTSLRGVWLLIRDDSELLDFEYADNTTLYIQNNVKSLLALEVFCLLTGAKINWHKSVGFLTNPRARSQQDIFLGVIPKGQTTLPWFSHVPRYRVSPTIPPNARFHSMEASLLEHRQAFPCKSGPCDQSSPPRHCLVHGLLLVLL